MGRIQVKVAWKDLKGLVGSPAHLDVILKSNQVIRVKVLKLEKDKLTVKNGLGHKRVLLLQDIREIWSDKKAPVHT